MKEPQDDENCRLVAERAVDQTVEALAYSEAAGETRRKRRGSKHHRAPSMSEQAAQREPRSATGRSTSAIPKCCGPRDSWWPHASGISTSRQIAEDARAASSLPPT